MIRKIRNWPADKLSTGRKPKPNWKQQFEVFYLVEIKRTAPKEEDVKNFGLPEKTGPPVGKGDIVCLHNNLLSLNIMIVPIGYPG